jgi:FKBP-type peptidyl-prolyl cis-trans isomerase
MRLRWISGMVVLAAVLVMAQAGFAADAEPAKTPETAATEKPLLKEKKDWVSYSIGVETGRNIVRREVEVDPDLVAKGLMDALTGKKLLMTDDQIAESLQYLYSDVRAKQRKDRVIWAQDNKAEGDKFMAENKARPGVVTLPDGVQYRIIKVGNGEKPQKTSKLECNIRGALVDGTVFENSYATGKPTTLDLTDPSVVPGLKVALKMMPVGSMWQIVVPPTLAYLNHGSGVVIGPNATLVYEVELLSIK